MDLFDSVRLPLMEVPSLSHFVNDFEKVRQLLTEKAWDQAVELLNRDRTEPLPAEMDQGIRGRARAKGPLSRGTRTGRDHGRRRIHATPGPLSVAGRPPCGACSRRERHRNASQVIPVLEQLKNAQRSRLVEAIRGDLGHPQTPLLAGRVSGEKISVKKSGTRAPKIGLAI